MKPSRLRVASRFNDHLERFASWLRLSMSMDEAKQTLGFPPGYNPTPQEIARAYKGQAKLNHPDHGGSHRKMVEINVAKDVLLGKVRPTAPGSRPPKSEEEIRREEEEATRQRHREANRVIDIHHVAVGKAVALSFKALDLKGWRLDISEFIVDEFIPALDKIQDMIDESETKSHPDMRKADSICASLSNKAMRVSKKYQAFQSKVDKANKDGEVTYTKMVDLYAEARKFLAGFADLFQESRNLRTLIGTSEHVPFEWDEIYNRPHSVLDSFSTSSSSGYGLHTHGLEAYEQTMLDAVKGIGEVLVGIDPKGWAKAPTATEWKYPADFHWAAELVGAKV